VGSARILFFFPGAASFPKPGRGQAGKFSYKLKFKSFNIIFTQHPRPFRKV
jgi:hypothetical protein